MYVDMIQSETVIVYLKLQKFKKCFQHLFDNYWKLAWEQKF